MIEKVVTALRDAMDFATSEQQAQAMAYVKAIEIYDDFIRQSEVKYPREKEPACKKGCSYCCETIKVALHNTELSVLLNVSPFTIDELKGRLNNGHKGCPFLEDGCCSIYEFRPLKCRGANCYDVEFCKKPPLLYSTKTAPIWHAAIESANIVHQALGKVYGEKARPIDKIVEEYDGK